MWTSKGVSQEKIDAAGGALRQTAACSVGRCCSKNVCTHCLYIFTKLYTSVFRMAGFLSVKRLKREIRNSVGTMLRH